MELFLMDSSGQDFSSDNLPLTLPMLALARRKPARRESFRRTKRREEHHGQSESFLEEVGGCHAFLALLPAHLFAVEGAVLIDQNRHWLAV